MSQSELLDKIYDDISTIILNRQHPLTGLFPASTDVNTHGDYTDAWVRDNVYTILSVWTLSIAFKKIGDRRRQDELEQSTITLMRGLLQSMMRQSKKVESFKNSLEPLDSLHAKFDTETGLEVVADDAWGHLQIDATSLFLLILAQMSAGGLRIVLTKGEANFIQNLVYYISRAYRTPDFGIWERGNKINNGKTEVNASSVGMAKAALQALDGLNVFGINACPSGIIHTVADSIARARTTLQALLPRESRSKEVDGALLSIIGFPAFSVSDNELMQRTKDEILNKLQGEYGCKRFLLDGHQTAIEDASRMYYEHSELINFEHIESEWPLFFTYLYINALYSKDVEEAAFYRRKLENLMVEKDGMRLLPELYYVDKQNIDAERDNPGSQPRVPNDNVPLIWAQSLYTVGLLLDEGFVDGEDLDACRLRHQQTRDANPSVALVILAKDDKTKQLLSEHGVISETIARIQPLKVISASHLVDAFSYVGANAALGLTGRPERALQSLATSHPYNINGQQLLCLSWLQNDNVDYRKHDARLLAETFRNEIKHIKHHWFYKQPAIFTVLIDKSMTDMPNAEELFKTLRGFQLRDVDDRISHATAELAYRAARVHHMSIPNICLTTISGRKETIRRSLEDMDLRHGTEPHVESLRCLFGVNNVADKYHAMNSLMQNRSLKSTLAVAGKPYPVFELVREISAEARSQQQWLLVRQCHALLEEPSADLADALAELMVRRLVIVLGHSEGRQHHIKTELTKKELQKVISDTSEDLIEQSLMQELLLTLGGLVRTEPELFHGLRTIRLHHLLVMCAEDRNKEDASIINELGLLTPFDLYEQVRHILKLQHRMMEHGVSLGFYTSNMHRDRSTSIANRASWVLGTDWFEWRIARGMITRFDEEFLKMAWEAMKYTDALIFGDKFNQQSILDCNLALTSMTPGEESFAVLLEKLLSIIHPAYYKSMIIEALCALSIFCEETPNFYHKGALNLSVIVDEAAENYRAENIDADLNHENAVNRNLDYLLQAPPQIVQLYLKRAITNIATLASAGEPLA